MSNKRTPEYESLRSHLHGICSSISSQFHTISPLANDLCAARIISDSTKNAVVNTSGIPPYELAAQLMSSVQVCIQFNPGNVYQLAEKLDGHGHSEVALNLLKECEKRGGRKVSKELLDQRKPHPQEEEEEYADISNLKQEPKLRLFHKHVGIKLHDRWHEIGTLLGVPSLSLRTIESTMKSNTSKAILEVFEGWKQSNEVDFTWESLFRELDSSTIQKSIIREIKRNVIKDLMESEKK